MGTPPRGAYHGTVRRCHLCHLDHCDAHHHGCDITRRTLVETLGWAVPLVLESILGITTLYVLIDTIQRPALPDSSSR